MQPQSKPFYLRRHPCPECCGNVDWWAVACPHCQYALTISDRYDVAPPGAKLTLFMGVFLGTAILLYVLLDIIGLF